MTMAKAPAKTPAALGTEPELEPAAPVSEDERLAQGEGELDELRAQLEATRQELAASEERSARFAAAAQISDPAPPPMMSEFEQVAGKPAEEGGIFTEADAKRTWRLVARNPNYSGETEGFGFSNGEGVATALPAGASPERVRVRVLRLNGLRNYPFDYRTKNAAGRNVTRQEPGYRVLTEAQYEAEYAERIVDGEELPEDL